ncbi:protein of unknown function [Streptomyces murinus]
MKGAGPRWADERARPFGPFGRFGRGRPTLPTRARRSRAERIPLCCRSFVNNPLTGPGELATITLTRERSQAASRFGLQHGPHPFEEYAHASQLRLATPRAGTTPVPAPSRPRAADRARRGARTHRHLPESRPRRGHPALPGQTRHRLLHRERLLRRRAGGGRQ